MLRLLLLSLLFVAAISADTEIQEDTDKIQPEEQPEELQKKASNYCYSEGRILRNGQETRMRKDRCATYVCQYGRLRQSKRECNVQGKCYAVGRTWTEKCVTYRCTSRRGRNGYSYNVETVSSKCIDAHGNCRQPGDHFPHVVLGRFHSRCTCRQWRERNQLKTKYQC